MSHTKREVMSRTILITGAGSGLGRLVAIRLAKLGAKLTLSDLTLASV
jgi:NAD(P)-dependent dehydrogenase (short-subunit alcohol dehydrogenase family)